MKDYYRILEVSEYASDDVIKNAYKTLSKKYHPDLHKSQYKIFEQKMKEINEAYNVLINPETRKEYDQSLKKEKEKPVIVNNPYKNNINESNVYTSNKSEKEQKIMNSLNLNKIIILAMILSIIVLLFIFVSISKVFNIDDFNIKNVAVGVSENYITQNYGEPIDYDNNVLIYENFAIILENEKVIGWIDIYKELNLGERKTINEKDIRIGEPIDKIINKKGNPDVLLKKIAIYDNIIIYLKDGYIEKFETIK